MKKKLIIILSSIVGVIFISTAILIACSNAEPTNGISETESGTVTINTHLSPSESESLTKDILTETEKVSEGSSSDIESKTESFLTEESAVETETEAPMPSLEYISHGNGTCAVSGIGDITDAYVTIPLRSPDGDVVTSIAEKAFFSNSFIRAVEIPSTVSHIGDMAFAGCSELVYLSVDNDNKAFTDIGGILFTSDMTRILAYPSSSGASSISIPVSVTKISPMAFFECNNLKTIEYAGSAGDWSRIDIGDVNYGLYSTSIICKETEK